MRITFFPLLLVWLFLSGQLFAQDMEKYLDQPLPDSWNTDETFQQTLPVNDFWWKAFEDPQLDSLIQLATEYNYSVLNAIENMNTARINWRITQGDFYPSLQLGAGWTRQKTSGNTTGSPEAWYGYYNGTLSMSWEIDVFGNIRKRAKAQKLQFQATEEEFRAVMISLCADVATAYFNLRESQQELRVITENSESQKSVVDITQVRYNAGLASKLDVAEAKSVYYSTLASIPTVQASIIQYKNELAVLIGTYPEKLSRWLDTPKDLPVYIEPVGVSYPSNLLRRRPDIREAERVVAASAASLGASKSEWLPSFFLNGSFGYASNNLKDMIKNESMTWEIAPSMTWTFFSGGKIYNATRLARVELNQNIIEYNSTVLTAIQEVENAMATYKNSIQQMIALREAVNQGIETLSLSLDLYKQGLSPFQNVLDAQRSLLSYQDSLVQAHGYSLLCLIQLYKALGGGWEF